MSKEIRDVLVLVLCAAAACGDPAVAPHKTGRGASEAEPSPDDEDEDDDSSSSPVQVPRGGAQGAAMDAGKAAKDGGARLLDASVRVDAAAAVGEGDGFAEFQADAMMEPVVAPVPCTPNAYVSNSYSDSVSVIDTNTHKVVATVPTGKAPINPTFTPDRRQVYVANSQADTLTVIDVETNEATTLAAGAMSPSGLAFGPDGDTLYVSYIGESFVAPGSVASIQLSTGKVSPPIPMGADPERIALTPNGERLYVNNLLDGTMAVVDTATSKVIAKLTLGDLPFNPLMSPDGTVVYVGVMSANHIAVVDTTTNMVTRTIPADSPNGMTFSNDFQTLFVSNALSGTVQEVSLTMNKVLRTEDVGGLPGNMAVLPDGKLAYMVRPDGTTVEVLDTSTLKIVQTITAGEGPTVVTICRAPVSSRDD